MIKKLFLNLKNFFCSQRLYSKNLSVIFFVLFLMLISVFYGQRLKYFSKQITNQPLKNVLTGIAEPIAHVSNSLPFENFFSNARTNVLRTLRLENNYHWDDFYYTSQQTYGFTKENLINNFATGETSNTPTTKSDLPFTTDFTNHQNSSSSKTNSNLIVVQHEYSKTHPLRVLCIGDSLMQSIGEGFRRCIQDSACFEVEDIAVVSSGFIRTDYYNWPAKLQDIFDKANTEDKPFDVAVLLLGMNDNQNFFDGNGQLFRFGTDEWVVAYQEKIKTVIDILEKNVKKIYWLGLPFVKSASLNSALTIIENAQASAAKFFEPTKLYHYSIRENTKANRYSDTIQDASGKTIQLMKSDGIHYTLAGASYIMENVKSFMHKDFNIEPEF